MDLMKKFRQLELDGGINTKETEETKKFKEDVKLELGNFELEQDKDNNFYLVIGMDFEDFGDEEDEKYFDSFIKSIFGSMEHHTFHDGENEIYMFPISDVNTFFNEEILSAIKNIRRI